MLHVAKPLGGHVKLTSMARSSVFHKQPVGGCCWRRGWPDPSYSVGLPVTVRVLGDWVCLLLCSVAFPHFLSLFSPCPLGTLQAPMSSRLTCWRRTGRPHFMCGQPGGCKGPVFSARAPQRPPGGRSATSRLGSVRKSCFPFLLLFPKIKGRGRVHLFGLRGIGVWGLLSSGYVSLSLRYVAGEDGRG